MASYKRLAQLSVTVMIYTALVVQANQGPNCKWTVGGAEYTGHTNVTKSGLVCQRWDVQTPHSHTRGEMFPDGTGTMAENYCRNPDNDDVPWCYTEDASVRVEYCDISLCKGPNCKRTVGGAEYTGHTNVTKSGLVCQRWDVQTPHSHTRGEMFPDGTGTMAENYCRNPDNDDVPWCYTEDASVRVGYCDIPFCEDLNCKLTAMGMEYAGTISVTKSGRTCQRWDVQTPHSHTQTTLFLDGTGTMDVNYCRSLEEGNAPWCYTTDQSVRYEYCDIPFCQGFHVVKECKLTEVGLEYAGHQNVEQTGRTCQRWDTQAPHSHTYNPLYSPNDTVKAYRQDNYCRNPSAAPEGLWCYTVDPDWRWDYCHLPFCSDARFKQFPTTQLGGEVYNQISEKTRGMCALICFKDVNCIAVVVEIVTKGSAVGECRLVKYKGVLMEIESGWDVLWKTYRPDDT